MRSYKKVAKMLGLEDYILLGQVLFDDFHKVELSKSKVPMSISREGQQIIDAIWKEHIAEKKEDFDGSVGSIISVSKSPEGFLNIKFHEGKFSQFYATAAIREEELYVKSFPLDAETCLPISFGAVAITKDNYILFALRGQTTFDPETVTLLPGGYFNPETDYFFVRGASGRPVKNYSIPVTILRELFEETGITLPCLKVEYLGLVYNKEGSKQPLLACRINLPFTVEEIKKRMHLDEESTKIFFVKNDINEIKKFLFYSAYIDKKNIAIHDAWKLILHFLTGDTK